MSPEPNHIDAVIADLEGWKERISATIDTLRMFRSGGGAVPGGPPSTELRTPLRGEIQHDTFFQMSVPDASEKYLTLMKKTQPISELASALLRGGLKSSAKNFPAMVKTILNRESRFVKVNSEWGLRAWYPAMRKVTGRKRQIDGAPLELNDAEKGEVAPPKASQSAQVGEEFSSDSLRGRTLALLISEPNTAFNAPNIAARLEVENVGSVSAALSILFRSDLIRRGRKGWYQSK